MKCSGYLPAQYVHLIQNIVLVQGCQRPVAYQHSARHHDISYVRASCRIDDLGHRVVHRNQMGLVGVEDNQIGFLALFQ